MSRARVRMLRVCTRTRERDKRCSSIRRYSTCTRTVLYLTNPMRAQVRPYYHRMRKERSMVNSKGNRFVSGVMRDASDESVDKCVAVYRVFAIIGRCYDYDRGCE